MEQKKLQEFTFTVNSDKTPNNPSDLKYQRNAEQSLKARCPQAQVWKSDCPDNLLSYTRGNGLVDAVHLAYEQHYNLELSPDDIWLAILQGFATHLELNHEKLRKQFVDFDGQKDLSIQRPQYFWPTNANQWDWEGCFSEWGDLIKQNIGPQNYQNLMCQFTTTTIVSQACFDATIMNSMKNYFKYVLCGGCGLPQVKLTGTLEDWQKIREKVQNLGQYDLEWWTQNLIPILDKFIESYQGKVDQMFWNCIYKYVPYEQSGTNYVSGWILNFFPYIKDFGQTKKSDYLKSLDEIFETYQKIQQTKQVKEDIKNLKLMASHMTLGGMFKTPFKFQYQGGGQVDLLLVAGFHNVCYEGKFIKPAKGWAITESKPGCIIKF